MRRLPRTADRRHIIARRLPSDQERAADRRQGTGPEADRRPTLHRRATARRVPRSVAALTAVALLVSGCGASAGLSAAQLRTRARRDCLAAARSLQRIPSPAVYSGAGAFLARGIAVIGPELTALRRLHPAGGVTAAAYSTALDASRAELSAMRLAVRRIDRNADPIATLRALQARLTPLETRADAAWRSLGLGVCADA